MKAFIDVHCHLDLCSNPDEKIKNAREAGVAIIATQGINMETNRAALSLAEKYKEVKAALGLYPVNALHMTNQEIDEEIEFIRKNKKKVFAIGEVGMDFKESQDRQSQELIFTQFVRLARELDKPVIVHSRKAEEECIKILEAEKARKVIMHCFCGKWNLVERIVKNGWLLSIPGIVRYSEQFQKIALDVPIENLACETDSPYLHPGKMGENEPANVLASYKKIAELKRISVKETREKIWDNLKRIS